MEESLEGWIAQSRRDEPWTYVCPSCASEDVIPIIYGKPCDNQIYELQKEGKLIHRGCVRWKFASGVHGPKAENAPTRRCTACGKEWYPEKE